MKTARLGAVVARAIEARRSRHYCATGRDLLCVDLPRHQYVAFIEYLRERRELFSLNSNGDDCPAQIDAGGFVVIPSRGQ